MKRASLNHVFRLVWSRRQQCPVPVCEHRRRAGKQGGRRAATLILAMLPALPLCALAEGVRVANGSGATSVYQAPNGVTVVDIDTANAQGLSHNKFLDYNVDHHGLVLNNGNMDQTTRQSQLAGRIYSNANLDQSARVILNEVVSTNRSQLSGFTEVVGDQADVVLANPYGITCDGCGFINTDRVTLSTGTPNIDNGALTGFDVRRGRVLISGAGLNATNQDYFDIVARSVKLDGIVNANTLNITAGASHWDYQTRQASAADGDGAAFDLAFDSTALGGMYANRITIHATEAGVGVRMLGDAAASGADFRIDAAGRIKIGADVSARQDLALRTSATDTDAIKLDNARLTADHDLTLHADGGATLSGGALVAGGTLSADLASLGDRASNGGAENNNQRFGADGVALNLDGAADLNGVDWGSQGNLDLRAGALTIGAEGAHLYGDTLSLAASRGDLNLGGARVVADNDLTLDANGAIETGNGADQIIASRDGDVTARAKAGVTNRGLIAASGGSLTLNADGTVHNSGTLYAGDAVTLTDSQGNGAENLSNDGTIESGGALTVHAATLDNNKDGLILAGSGSSITAHTLNNQGVLVASNDNTAAILQANALTNGTAATLQAGGALSLTLGTSLDNQGKLLAGADLTVQGSDYQVTNSNVIQSAGTLCITGDSGCDDAPSADNGVDLTLNGDAVLAGQNLVLHGDTLTLNGHAKISSAGDLRAGLNALTVADSNAAIVGATQTGTAHIAVSGALSNHGAIHSGTDLTLSAGALSNSDTAGLSAADTLSLTTTAGDLNNAGALYAGGNVELNANSGDVTNQETGTIDSGGDIASNSVDFTNHGRIIAAADIDLTVSDDFVNETTFGGASIGKGLGGASNARNQQSKGQIANEGGADKGMNAWIYEDDITRGEYLIGISEDDLTNKTKAQIISTGSNGTLSVHYGDSGLNRIAVLSAANVKLVAGDSQATFTNESLTLYQYHYTRRWIAIADEKNGDNYVMAWARTNPNASCNGCYGDNGIDNDDYVHDNWSPGSGWQKTSVKKGDYTFPTASQLNDARDMATAGAVRNGVQVAKSFGAGIFATNLTLSGGNFNNAGSPYQNASNVADSNLKGGHVTAVSVGAATALDPGAFSGDINLPPISLPTNPNGYFVSSQNPNAGYLVETNPIFTNGDRLGSNYLVDRLGLDVDEIGLRLGDAAYEAYLIRQQLINRTGGNLLAGYAGEQNMIKGLYDNANQQAGELDLTWGQPLTAAQANALNQDMVWMVEQEVGGKTVLAPVVYLSKATRDAINNGAVVAADNTVLDVNSVTNTGGTIQGADNLVIRSDQDITNTGGTLKGGNVYVESVNGSIINQTLAEGAGDDITYKTTIGKTGSIQSENELLLSAGQDITNLGADVSAGGTTVIHAGNDITFDTIEDKNTHTRFSGDGNHNLTTTETHNDNIGSHLNVGGDLGITSGNDTTIGGSDVNVDGHLAVKTGGSFNLEARQDQEITHSVKKDQGAGVGGGVYGRQTTTTDDFKGTNHGATLNVGGSAYVDSGKDITLLGSDMNVQGDAALNAKNDINVLDGLDERHTQTHTETQTFLSVDSHGDSATESDAQAGTGKASASATASASSEASNDTALNLYKKTVTDTDEKSTTSVASHLNVGGDLSAHAGNDITVRGSDLSGDNVTLSGQDVNILAGRNTHSKTTTETSTSVGLFVDSQADASASAGAGATGMSANAKANAQASANAQGTVTIGARHRNSTDKTTDLTHSASHINATGGNVVINAENDATFQGSHIKSAGDITIDAENINNLAAEDRHTESHQSLTQTAGLYVSGQAGADASADAKANPLGGSVNAQAEVGAEGSAGIRYGREEHSANSGSTHNQVNTFSAGGNITRHADDAILDQGTQLSAGGNINQSATTLTDQAVSDQTWSHSSDTSHEARLGVYGGGNSKVAAGAQAGVGANGTAGNETEAGAGVQASYDYSQKEKSSTSGTAVTSRYQAGGNITSTTSGKTELEGTHMQAGGDITLGASSLDYQAAHDTTSESSSDRSAHAGVKVNIAEKSANIDASYGQQHDKKSSSTAVTGGLTAGGGVRINTTGDTTLEGTSVSAGKGIDIHSESGDVNLLAAQDTASADSDGFNAGVSITAEKKKPGVTANGGYNQGHASATRSTGVTLNASGGDIAISSGQDTTLQGAHLDAGDNKVGIAAGGTVSLGEALDQSSSSYDGVDAGLQVGKKQQSGAVNISAGKTTDKQGKASSISGGQVTISGATVIDREADIDSGDTTIHGKVEKQTLTHEKSGFDVELDINGVKSKNKTLLGKKKPKTGSTHKKKKKKELMVPIHLPGTPGEGAPELPMPGGTAPAD